MEFIKNNREIKKGCLEKEFLRQPVIISYIDSLKAKIENIMTTKVDKELKSCDCQGTVFTGIFGVSGSVTYMAQENSEGEVIVNIVNAGPFGF